MQQEFKQSIDKALHNANLTGALGKFSEAYKVNRAKAYEGIDFEALRTTIAGLKGYAASHLEELSDQFQKNAEAKGANVVLDGRGFSSSVEGTEAGNWVGPTIVDNVPLETQLYCEEVFGPVLVVVKTDTYEEAIEIVNSSAFGNGSAIFTENGQVARQFQLDVNAGMVGINVPIPVPVGYYSFGGWKNSLLGDHKIHGQEGVNFYTRTKVVTTRWAGSGSHGKIGLDFVATK